MLCKKYLIIMIWLIVLTIDAMEDNYVPFTHVATNQEQQVEKYIEKIDVHFGSQHADLCKAIREGSPLKVASALSSFNRANQHVEKHALLVLRSQYISPLFYAIQNAGVHSKFGIKDDDSEKEQKAKREALKINKAFIIKLLCEQKPFILSGWQTENSTPLVAVCADDNVDTDIVRTLLETDIANQIELSEIDTALATVQNSKNQEVNNLLLKMREKYCGPLQTRGPGRGFGTFLKDFFSPDKKTTYLANFHDEKTPINTILLSHLTNAIKTNNREHIELLLDDPRINDLDGAVSMCQNALLGAIKDIDKEKVVLLLSLKFSNVDRKAINPNDNTGEPVCPIQLALDNYLQYKKYIKNYFKEKKEKNTLLINKNFFPQFVKAEAILVELLNRNATLNVPYEGTVLANLLPKDSQGTNAILQDKCLTPLKAALAMDDKALIELFLKHGAHINYNGEGNDITARDFAKICGNESALLDLVDKVRKEDEWFSSEDEN